MLHRLFTTCLLKPDDVSPSHPDLQVIGVFNPAAAKINGRTVLLVRVAERPRHAHPGCVALPRYEGGRPVVDQVPADQLILDDPRVVRRRDDGLARLTSVSHLRVIHAPDGRSVDRTLGPCFLPSTEYETFGVEDPRITRLDGRYYFTYVAVSPQGAATALASTEDFAAFHRHGIIFPPENKDVVLFPQRVGGRCVALHRPNPNVHFAPPQMWIAWSDDLVHWGGHRRLLGGDGRWAAGRIGGGCPPWKTERGWVEVYHGNDKVATAAGVGRYFGAACVTALDDPARLVARSAGPILVPEEPFEREGFVPDVVFPTALVEEDDTVLVYYGAADTCTAVTAFARDALLDACTAAAPG